VASGVNLYVLAHDALSGKARALLYYKTFGTDIPIDARCTLQYKAFRYINFALHMACNVSICSDDFTLNASTLCNDSAPIDVHFSHNVATGPHVIPSVQRTFESSALAHQINLIGHCSLVFGHGTVG
jgi:hypothetical protein